jgi:hypothetical protein
MYFEKANGENSLGTVALGSQVRKSLKQVLNVQTDTSENAMEIAIAKKDGSIRMESEKDCSGSAIELHATLLGVDPQSGDGHGMLQDVYRKLPLASRFTAQNAPTLEQVAKAYGQLVEPGLLFSIANIIFWEAGSTYAFVATLSRNESYEITNSAGEPVSATLGVTLANVDQSLLEDRSWIESVLEQLQKKLQGKKLRLASANGTAKLEFFRSDSTSGRATCPSAKTAK